MALHQRELAWEGCLNVRDLGGHRTEDGSETRYGAVVRADSVRQLTEAGWRTLVDYGVRTIVDLRQDEELAADPPLELPADVLHIPFMADADVHDEVEAAVQAAATNEIAYRDVYLIWLEAFKANVAAAIRAVAKAPDGGVVVHCVGGKDRTGLITALLLRLAGVGSEQVAHDYALSEVRLRPRHERWLAEAESESERERVRRSSQTPAAAILAVLDELDRRYGSVEGYLRAGGLSDGVIESARARLRA